MVILLRKAKSSICIKQINFRVDIRKDVIISFCYIGTDSVLDNLISCNKLDKNFRQKVKETLLCKHRHHRSAGFRRNLSNIMSTRKSFNNSSTKIPKNNSSTANGFHDSNHTVTNNVDVGHTVPGAAVATTPSSNIKLFRNYSQPAFPNSNNGVNKTQHTHQSPPVIDR